MAGKYKLEDFMRELLNSLPQDDVSAFLYGRPLYHAHFTPYRVDLMAQYPTAAPLAPPRPFERTA